jgi:hypothetical protein
MNEINKLNNISKYEINKNIEKPQDKETNKSSKSGIKNFINNDLNTQSSVIYNYSMSLMVGSSGNNSDINKNDVIQKLEDLIKLLKNLDILKEILEILTNNKDKIKKSNNSNDIMNILLGMQESMKTTFSYQQSTSVEMTSKEFTDIMDHMNSKDEYKNLSYEEKQYKIMETAKYISSGSFVNISA